MRLKVTISIDYDDTTVTSRREMRELLYNNLLNFVNNGGLSGDGEVMIDDYNISVEGK